MSTDGAEGQTAAAMTSDAARAYRSALKTAAEPPDGAAAAVRLAGALRRMARVVTGSTAPDELLDEVTGELERLADRLEPHAQPSRYTQAGRLSGTGMFITHPMIGPTNPVSPGIVMRPEGEVLRGRVTYGTTYEGPPDYVHGGYIAAAFDAIITMTAGINGRGGLTKSLAVRFRKPTPLNTEVVYEGAIDSRDERSTRVRGVLRAGDTVCAEGTGEIVYRPPSLNAERERRAR